MERKLRVPALFRMPELVGNGTGVARITARPPVTLTATYYDTDDLRLARWGVTLRRRTGGHDEGWHLKVPTGADPGERDEIQVPLDASPEGVVPDVLLDTVTALVREAPLSAVATLRTERTPFLLRDGDGSLIGELVDDVVSVMDGDRVAGRFREIEVEARELGIGVLAPVVDALMAVGAEPGTTSKAVHALGPRAMAPPDVPAPGQVTPRDPAAEAVRAHLLTHTRRLLLQDVRVRRDLPDAVHQMRVAARRLRSGLRTFRPLLDQEWAEALRSELAWVAGELGASRDTEVLLERLDDHAGRLPDPHLTERARSTIDPMLRARLVDAREHALVALRSPRHLALLVDLVDAARAPRFTDAAAEPGRKALPPLARKAWRRLRSDVEQLELDGPSPVWHETRIAGKKARYAAEALIPVFGGPARELARQLEQVTELLGEHQDAHVARLAIADLAATSTGSAFDGYTLGLLDGVERAAERTARLQFLAVWPKVKKAHRTSTLH